MPTMTENFLEDICRNPFDDTPRLILADYLDDHDQFDRAIFIRSQVEYAKLPPRCQKTGEELDEEITSPYHYRKRCRCRVCCLRRKTYLSARRWIVWEWTATLREATSQDAEAIARAIEEGRQFHFPILNFTWNRGFIQGITTSEKDWLAFGEKLIGLAPLEWVDLQEKKPFSFGGLVMEGGWGWYDGSEWNDLDREDEELQPDEIHPLLYDALTKPDAETSTDYHRTDYRHKRYSDLDVALADLKVSAVNLYRQRLSWPLLPLVLKWEAT